MKFGESGLRFWSDSVEGMIQIGRSTFYGGINLSPALMAVGFIIGLPTAVVVLLGGVLGWLVLLPLDQWLSESASAGSGVLEAKTVWSQHIRYVGIGAMLVGGLWTLVEVRGPVLQSLRRLILAYRKEYTSQRGCAYPSYGSGCTVSLGGWTHRCITVPDDCRVPHGARQCSHVYSSDHHHGSDRISVFLRRCLYGRISREFE